MRTAIAAAALVLAGGLLSFGAVEVALRLTGFGRQFVVPDARIGYRLTPDFTRTLEGLGIPTMRLATNDLGLRRDTPTALAKPAGTTRVLVLGDSQTEGIVENSHTYSSVLEERLAAAGMGPLEVLNAGVSGYSPLLEYLWLREWGLRLDPDLVVLALYAGNDVADLTARETNFAGFGPRLHFATMTDDDGAWVVRRPGSPSVPMMIDAWLRAYSRAWNLLRSRLHGGPPPADSPIGRVAQTCPGCLQVLWQAWLAETKPADYQQALARLGGVLDLVKAATADVGARLLVVLLPTKLEIEPQAVRDAVAVAGNTLGLRRPPESNSHEARQWILEACRARGIESVDLLADLREARTRKHRDLYWPLDWHLDIEGNRAVAEALFAPVSRQLESAARTASPPVEHARSRCGPRSVAAAQRAVVPPQRAQPERGARPRAVGGGGGWSRRPRIC